MSVIIKLIYTIAILFLLLTAFEIGTGHASTTKSRPNNLGLSQVYTNNNAYLLALPVEGTSLDGGNFTSIRFEPYNTPSLGVPKGCIVKDANEIIPESEIKQYVSLANFCDAFRYRLLQSKENWWDESVLFCGNVANFFHNENGTPVHGVVVVVYDRIGHKMFRGLSCHDMVNVFPMEKQ